MSRRMLLLLLTAISVIWATELAELKSLYTRGKYKQACNRGLSMFQAYKKDGNFLMLYGMSCLEADYIDRLAVPITGLRDNRSERQNASFFATILLQKKLLYHALLDQIDLHDLKLPETGYILSEVFSMYVKKKYVKKNNRYLFSPAKNPKMIYELYLIKESGYDKMVLNERFGGNVVKSHIYW